LIDGAATGAGDFDHGYIRFLVLDLLNDLKFYHNPLVGWQTLRQPLMHELPIDTKAQFMTRRISFTKPENALLKLRLGGILALLSNTRFIAILLKICQIPSAHRAAQDLSSAWIQSAIYMSPV